MAFAWLLTRRGHRSVRFSRVVEASGLLFNNAVAAWMGRYLLVGFVQERSITDAEEIVMADGYVSMLLLGGLVPDLSMFVFFAWHAGVLHTPQAQIWGVEYFEPAWELAFDLPHSIPIGALGLALAWRRRSAAGIAFFASLLLHAAVDLALHNDDAHRHFLPLATWRFESPVSYWDPRHHGRLGALLELGAVLAGSVATARRHRHAIVAGALGGVSALYVSLYLYLYAGGG